MASLPFIQCAQPMSSMSSTQSAPTLVSMSSTHSANQTNLILLLNMANLKSVKLDSSNYIVWTHQITSIIKTYSLIQHLDNSIPILGQYPRDSNSKGNFMNQVNLEFEAWQILD